MLTLFFALHFLVCIGTCVDCLAHGWKSEASQSFILAMFSAVLAIVLS